MGWGVCRGGPSRAQHSTPFPAFWPGACLFWAVWLRLQPAGVAAFCATALALSYGFWRYQRWESRIIEDWSFIRWGEYVTGAFIGARRRRGAKLGPFPMGQTSHKHRNQCQERDRDEVPSVQSCPACYRIEQSQPETGPNPGRAKRIEHEAGNPGYLRRSHLTSPSGATGLSAAAFGPPSCGRWRGNPPLPTPRRSSGCLDPGPQVPRCGIRPAPSQRCSLQPVRPVTPLVPFQN